MPAVDLLAQEAKAASEPDWTRLVYIEEPNLIATMPVVDLLAQEAKAASTLDKTR